MLCVYFVHVVRDAGGQPDDNSADAKALWLEARVGARFRDTSDGVVGDRGRRDRSCFWFGSFIVIPTTMSRE